jgi:uncharacterized protein (DUF362 family)/NAD-dependent dihydropyrimidine dehydrogenase PreA subunit
VNRSFESGFSGFSFNGIHQVLIKPNLVVGSSAETGVTTDLAIVKAIIKNLQRKGIGSIKVGESSLWHTETVFNQLNVYELNSSGVEVVNFDKYNWNRVDFPKAHAMKSFYLPEVFFSSDLIISVAKMKTHSLTKVTLGIKNLLGLIRKQDRQLAHLHGINESIVDVLCYIMYSKKLAYFVDGIYALEGKNGPTVGRPIGMNLIVSGQDGLAVDAVCAELMGCDPNSVPYLVETEKRKLGRIRDNRVIVGEVIEHNRMLFDVPDVASIDIKYLRFLRKLFKKRPYFKAKEKCERCGRCVKSCPMGAISLGDDEIGFAYGECISCLICCESCVYGALEYRIRFQFLYRCLRILYHLLKDAKAGILRSSRL